MDKTRFRLASGAPLALSRRRFVQGLGAGAFAAASTGRWTWAAGGYRPAELSGTEFNLGIDATPVNFTGKSGIAHTINGQLPGPLLRWREGTTVTLRVTNRLPVQTSIHWHGIIVPDRKSVV